MPPAALWEAGDWEASSLAGDDSSLAAELLFWGWEAASEAVPEEEGWEDMPSAWEALSPPPGTDEEEDSGAAGALLPAAGT